MESNNNNNDGSDDSNNIVTPYYDANHGMSGLSKDLTSVGGGDESFFGCHTKYETDSLGGIKIQINGSNTAKNEYGYLQIEDLVGIPKQLHPVFAAASSSSSSKKETDIEEGSENSSDADESDESDNKGDSSSSHITKNDNNLWFEFWKDINEIQSKQQQSQNHTHCLLNFGVILCLLVAVGGFFVPNIWLAILCLGIAITMLRAFYQAAVQAAEKEDTFVEDVNELIETKYNNTHFLQRGWLARCHTELSDSHKYGLSTLQIIHFVPITDDDFKTDGSGYHII